MAALLGDVRRSGLERPPDAIEVDVDDAVPVRCGRRAQGLDGTEDSGTGPAGGGGIDEVTKIAVTAYIKAALTLRDPRHFLFFPRTAEGKRAATDYMARLKERTEDRDKRISPMAMRAQLKAIRAAGVQAPHDLGKIRQPVLVANGDHDVMVASKHSADMARRLPNAKLVIYPNSGHGGVFQYHQQFVPEVLEFLAS